MANHPIGYRGTSAMSAADPAVEARSSLFSRLADELLAEPSVSEGTLMGFPCLRTNSQFFAILEHRTSHLIVKLPAARVHELVSSGAGLPFSPNGRVFREWIAFPVADEHEWRALLREAKVFADG
jgi:hypothetical protein